MQGPQQANTYDCGIFALSNMLSLALNISKLFTQDDLAYMWDHIVLQLWQSQIHNLANTAELTKQASMPRTPQTSTSHAASVDMEAAQALVQLSGSRPTAPKHKVHFDNQVQVHLFRNKIER